MSIVEMRIYRWITRNIWKNKIQNEQIHLKIRMTLIDEKLRENHLKQFGHVKRREINALVKMS